MITFRGVRMQRKTYRNQSEPKTDVEAFAKKFIEFFFPNVPWYFFFADLWISMFFLSFRLLQGLSFFITIFHANLLESPWSMQQPSGQLLLYWLNPCQLWCSYIVGWLSDCLSFTLIWRYPQIINIFQQYIHWSMSAPPH